MKSPKDFPKTMAHHKMALQPDAAPTVLSSQKTRFTMKKNIQSGLVVLACVMALGAAAQETNKKIWISGTARGVMFDDTYRNNTSTDTVTARNLQSGHAMVDLGVNIQPTQNTFIHSMVRVRNDYGGFWGSGVSFDIRQLYIRGVIANVINYQLGDIDYKLGQYTFNNNTALVHRQAGLMTNVPLQQLQYDLFYFPDNTWRQQGAALDFGLQFRKAIQEMTFHGFTTRVRATNFGDLDDRLFSGGSVKIIQSKNLILGGQMVSLYDYAGTSNNTMFLRNPVMSANAEYHQKIAQTQLKLALEAGRSTLRWEGNEEAPVLEDFFYDARLRADFEKMGLAVEAGYRNVGANFRSAGAQTMQINFGRNALAYQRYGNAQTLRQISMLDLYRDASLYRTQIAAGLADFDPRYDNATPYGIATPNRRGFSLDVDYEDPKKRWLLAFEGAALQHVVGEGTEALKQFTTGSLYAELRFDEILGIKNRKLWLSGRSGLQNTVRNGDAAYENVDLATQFNRINVTIGLIKDFDFIAEYSNWQTQGFDLVASRNQYSQINDFREYNIDYNEQIFGAGLQYTFSEKTKLHALWQSFAWTDNGQRTQNYAINTWTLFFTMNF